MDARVSPGGHLGGACAPRPTSHEDTQLVRGDRDETEPLVQPPRRVAVVDGQLALGIPLVRLGEDATEQLRADARAAASG